MQNQCKAVIMLHGVCYQCTRSIHTTDNSFGQHNATRNSYADDGATRITVTVTWVSR